MIAGTASGVGKTTATIGLCRALRARGLRVALFKCGPDYLDPTYHARAAGRPSQNLDGWMMGRAGVLATFARAAAGADVAIIEGVMGLFDGASPTSEEGSTAEIAKWLAAPVALVVDAGGMARSLAAVAAGFAAFDPELRIAAIVANRVGSRGHLDLLRNALGPSPASPILGAFPKSAAHELPSRHLGLRTADPAHVPEALFDAWGGLTDEWWAIDALLAVARGAPALPPPEPPRITMAPRPCRIGLAHDEAFHFYYEENLRQLEACGATLVRFSPLGDARLPDVDGLYVGGGYPELFAERLAANAGLRAAIAAFAATGRPVYAECGGLMYLSQAIRTLDGRRHEMVGLLAGEAVMADRLEALGYVEVETRSVTPLGPAGLRFRGHQFRYSRLVDEAASALAYSLRKRRGGETSREGYLAGNVLGSYVHAHWASNPLVAQGFVEACASRAARRPA